MLLSEFFNHNFKNGDFKFYDKTGNILYQEKQNSSWIKICFKDNKLVYWEDSKGYWGKTEYKDNNIIYRGKNLNGYWEKIESKYMIKK